MGRAVRSLVFLGTFAALAASGGVARAGGWAVDRFEATPGGDLFFASDMPWYASPRGLVLRAALLGDVADRPLLLVPTGQAGSQGLIDQMVISDLQATVAVHDWLNLGLTLPLSLVQTGSSMPGVPVGPASGAAAGDLRLAARARLYGDAEIDPISLHFGASVDLPTGSQNANVGDGAAGVRAYGILAGHSGAVRWSWNGGFHYRPSTTIGATATTIGSNFFTGGAIGYALADDRLTIGPEAWASTELTHAFQSSAVNAEAIVGAHYELTDEWRLGAGAGLGLTQGIGTPEWRALAGLTYSTSPFRSRPTEPEPEVAIAAPPAPPPPADRDHDGVLDAVDQCPDTPQGAQPDPQRPGCPLAADTDHDGVPDDADKCPTVPQGDHPDPDKPGCPDGDRDGDGVPDHTDLCPDQPPGLHPDPNRPGCPMPDRDGDSVPDAVDACPDTPGAPDPDPKKNGCPSTVKIENGFIVVLKPLFFQTDGDRCLPRSYPTLYGLVNAMKATPEIRKLSIEGNTDNTGTHRHNMDLSHRRAAWVMKWMIKHGVEESRLEAQGFGETRPVATNDTEEGRALNRRVEFRIIDPPTSQPAAFTPVALPGGAPHAARAVPAMQPTSAPTHEPASGSAPRPPSPSVELPHAITPSRSSPRSSIELPHAITPSSQPAAPASQAAPPPFAPPRRLPHKRHH